MSNYLITSQELNVYIIFSNLNFSEPGPYTNEYQNFAPLPEHFPSPPNQFPGKEICCFCIDYSVLMYRDDIQL